MAPLSFFQRYCRACRGGYDFLVFGKVGERERESAKKKQIQKPSSSPAAHLGEEEEEQCRSKRHRFRLLFFFK